MQKLWKMFIKNFLINHSELNPKINTMIVFIVLFPIFTFAQISSYQMEDTPQIIANNNTKFTQIGKPYFAINWFEGDSQDGVPFSRSDWQPYAPNFDSPFIDMKKSDTVARIRRIEEENIATGVIVYNQFKNKNYVTRIQKVTQELNLEFFLKIYSIKNGLSSPIFNFPDQFHDFVTQQNVNWYFVDDIHRQFWNKKDSNKFAEILHVNSPEKKLLSCSNIINYTSQESYMLDYVDIIAPQLYPLRKPINRDVNLKREIPKFYQFTKFHYDALQSKKVVIENNKSNQHKVHLQITLPLYHKNLPPGRRITRFPGYEELRFQFYVSIICGAKGLNLFAHYRTNQTSKDNLSEIVNEFRDSGFQTAVLNGKYLNELINSKSIEINNDLNDEFGKKNWDIDYATYKLEDTLFLMIANTSRRELTTQLDYEMFDLKSEKVKLNPFEIKLIKKEL